MPEAYASLAPYYNRLGLSDFAEAIVPNILDYAHSQDWVGRRIVDFGCGTGGAVRWLVQHGYNITGIDTSASMLDAARTTIDARGVALQWLQGDTHLLAQQHDVDLVLAIDVVNELASLREVEGLFAAVARILTPGKWFAFDLHTLAGLTAVGGTTIAADDDRIFAVVAPTFDHERQTRLDHYHLFRQDGGVWNRSEAIRGRRGFPVQVITTLLTRAGFTITGLVNEAYQAVSAATPDGPRVLCFAARTG